MVAVDFSEAVCIRSGVVLRASIVPRDSCVDARQPTEVGSIQPSAWTQAPQMGLIQLQLL